MSTEYEVCANISFKESESRPYEVCIFLYRRESILFWLTAQNRHIQRGTRHREQAKKKNLPCLFNSDEYIQSAVYRRLELDTSISPLCNRTLRKLSSIKYKNKVDFLRGNSSLIFPSLGFSLEVASHLADNWSPDPYAWEHPHCSSRPSFVFYTLIRRFVIKLQGLLDS